MGQPVLFQASTIKTITREKKKERKRTRKGEKIRRNAVLKESLNYKRVISFMFQWTAIS